MCIRDSGKGACGVAFLDISTGEFLTAEGPFDYVDKLLNNFAPKEVLFERGKRLMFEGNFGSKFFTFELDDWVFTETSAREKLLKHFEVKNLKGFGVEHLKNGIIASGAILQYLIMTQHTQIGHVTSLARIEEDNYNGIVWSGAGGEGMPSPPGRTAEFPIGGVTGHTTTQPAAEAFLAVVGGAGAWPRDKVDLRAATDARNGTSTGYTDAAGPSKAGLIDTPSQVGGYPAYETTEAPADSDGDGMPDAWELARRLDPSDPDDGAAKSLSEAYTNVEIYLHECAAALLRGKRVNEK